MLRPGPVLTLEAEDLADEAVRRRLEARKTACFVGVAKPAARIGAMYEAASAHCTGAIAVYVERVADARGIAARLAGAHGAERVAVLTGTLRGRERSALVAGAVWERFAPKRERTRALPAVYLVMTSAGEVGVDLDADHAVMDLALLDSMIQRLGRVNRAGLGSATVTVVHDGARFGAGRAARDGRGAAPRGAARDPRGAAELAGSVPGDAAARGSGDAGSVFRVTCHECPRGPGGGRGVRADVGGSGSPAGRGVPARGFERSPRCPRPGSRGAGTSRTWFGRVRRPRRRRSHSFARAPRSWRGCR